MVRSTDLVPAHRDHNNPASRHTILIAENPNGQSAGARDLLSESEHWLLDVVESVETTLSLVATRRYCVVLVDYNLPDGDAMPVIDWVRNRCPVVVMVNPAETSIGLDVLQRGAYDYIIKDELFDRLLPDVVNRALQKHGDDCELSQLRADLQTQSRHLAQVTADLRSLDTLKSELLTDASSEIQQPLDLIRRLVTLMGEGRVGEVCGNQKEYLTRVLRNCDLLELLIGDVFQLQGLQSGNHPVRRYKVRARTLIDTTVKRIVDSYPLEGHKMTLGQVDDDVFVLCDSELLAQSIQNLIEAALAFTPHGGRIAVSCILADHNLTIEITSDGPAMTYAERRKVWDRFETMVARSGQNRLRTGLELAIARSILDRHDGQVSLHSAPQQGNTFSASVPLWNGKHQLIAFLKDRMYNDPCGNDRLAFSILTPKRTPATTSTCGDGGNRELLNRLSNSLVSRLKLKPDNIITIPSEDAVAVLTTTGDSGGLMVMHRLIDQLANDSSLMVPIYCSTVMVTPDIAAEDWIAIAHNRAVLVCPKGVSAYRSEADHSAQPGREHDTTVETHSKSRLHPGRARTSDIAIKHVMDR